MERPIKFFAGNNTKELAGKIANAFGAQLNKSSIIEFSDGDQLIQEVMIDLVDTMQIDGDPGEKLEKFRNKYFRLIEKANKLFFGTQNNLSKIRKEKPSSLYWKLGVLLHDFNKEIKNEFEITNYTEAISRDFALSKDYHYDISTIIDIFKKNQILDSVPFSYYRALKRKRSDLVKLGLFDNEIKRLNKMGKENKLPGREKYKVELIDIIENSKKTHGGK